MSWQQYNGKPFSKQDNVNLSKQVKRFNRKAKRIIQKYENENIMLPELLSVKKIKEDIQYKQDLNNLYRSINRFMKKGSEELTTIGKNVKITKWQKHEIELGKQRSERNITNKINKIEESIKKLDLYDVDKETKYREFKFDTDEIKRLQSNKESLKNIKNRDKQSMENLVRRIDRFSNLSRLARQNKIYKENYIHTISEKFRYEDDYEEFIEFLEDIDEDDFFAMINYDEIARDIKTIYEEMESISKGKSYYSSNEFFDKIKNAWYDKADFLDRIGRIT